MWRAIKNNSISKPIINFHWFSLTVFAHCTPTIEEFWAVRSQYVQFYKMCQIRCPQYRVFAVQTRGNNFLTVGTFPTFPQMPRELTVGTNPRGWELSQGVGVWIRATQLSRYTMIPCFSLWTPLQAQPCEYGSFSSSRLFSDAWRRFLSESWDPPPAPTGQSFLCTSNVEERCQWMHNPPSFTRTGVSCLKLCNHFADAVGRFTRTLVPLPPLYRRLCCVYFRRCWLW